ncbi:MAG: tetratricopeptide repeat protein [Candidatus Gastranaerophilales bacterium]|nr:tetratricopeptide repeat protein [Candidatus Gastranaerophilales bacterium]
MKNFKKILLLCLSISSLYLYSVHITHAQSTISDRINSAEQLNIRITKDNFTDFRESLILNIRDENIRLNNLFFSNINLKLVNTPHLDIISSLRRAPSLYPSSKVNDSKTDINPPNIYNINLSSTGSNIQPSSESLSNSNKVNISPSQNLYNSLTTLQLIEKSNAAIYSKKNYEAQLYLDNAVVKAGRNSWSLAEIADNYEQIKKYDKATKTWEKAISINPNRIELLYSYVLYLCRNNQSDKAQKLLNKIISINPQFMLAYYNRGNIYFKKRQYISAITAYSKAISINPYCEDAFYNLALSLEAINQKSLAITYYKECIKLNPSDNQVKKALRRLRAIK